jgi:glycosyltransferase involved in cell wall biosynthesis
MADNPEITIVSPVYNAEKIVSVLVDRLKEQLRQMGRTFEIVLVDDGSKDDSWKTIQEICKVEPNVRGVKLSRNFGQHYAVTAGLEYARGGIVVLMDCDLQDDPAHLPRLLEKYGEGYEIVFTKRIDRKHSFLKSILAKLYNFCFYIFADSDYDVDFGSLTLFSDRVRREFLRIKDKDRLYIQVLKWLGFKSTYVEVEHRNRILGTSSYSFSKLMALAIQGWTSHSVKLLRFSTYFGFALAFLALLAGIVVIMLKITLGFQAGWASVIVSILFSTGVIQISIGILGIYLGKTFEQSKNRPLYIVEEELNV